MRGARRGLEEAIHAHRMGVISAPSLTALTGAYKAWVELFLAEAELQRMGLDVEAMDHPLGIDGGHVSGIVATPREITEVVTDDGTNVTSQRKVFGLVLPADFDTPALPAG